MNPPLILDPVILMYWMARRPSFTYTWHRFSQHREAWHQSAVQVQHQPKLKQLAQAVLKDIDEGTDLQFPDIPYNCVQRECSLLKPDLGTHVHPKDVPDLRLEALQTQHQELLDGKLVGPFIIFPGEHNTLNGYTIRKCIPALIATKILPDGSSKERLCRNGSDLCRPTDPELAQWYKDQRIDSTKGQPNPNRLLPSLNDQVDPRESTLNFTRVRDWAALSLLATGLAKADWKAAFRQLSLHPSYHASCCYMVASLQITCRGITKTAWLVLCDTRLWFGAARASRCFAKFPLLHTKATAEEERTLYCSLSHRQKKKYRPKFILPRRGCKASRPSAAEDYGLAPPGFDTKFLPRPVTKTKSYILEGRLRNVPVISTLPALNQSYELFWSFRLNRIIPGFLTYIDDVLYFSGNHKPEHVHTFKKYLSRTDTEHGAEIKDTKTEHSEPYGPITFAGVDIHPSSTQHRLTARLALPQDKRIELLKLLTRALTEDTPPFILLEKVLGKLGWWAQIDSSVWIDMVPLERLLAMALPLFHTKPGPGAGPALGTDPRLITFPRLESACRLCLSHLRTRLIKNDCVVPSLPLVWLPLIDGCLLICGDAAGKSTLGIGLICMGSMRQYPRGLHLKDPVSGIWAGESYPFSATDHFWPNLRQTEKEMMAVLLAVLLWGPLAASRKLPLHYITDNSSVLMALKKERSSTPSVWRILRAILTQCKRLDIKISCSWMQTQLIPADPLSRIRETPAHKEETNLRLRLFHKNLKLNTRRALPWSRAKRILLRAYLPIHIYPLYILSNSPSISSHIYTSHCFSA